MENYNEAQASITEIEAVAHEETVTQNAVIAEPTSEVQAVPVKAACNGARGLLTVAVIILATYAISVSYFHDLFSSTFCGVLTFASAIIAIFSLKNNKLAFISPVLIIVCMMSLLIVHMPQNLISLTKSERFAGDILGVVFWFLFMIAATVLYAINGFKKNKSRVLKWLAFSFFAVSLLLTFTLHTYFNKLYYYIRNYWFRPDECNSLIYQSGLVGTWLCPKSSALLLYNFGAVIAVIMIAIINTLTVQQKECDGGCSEATHPANRPFTIGAVALAVMAAVTSATNYQSWQTVLVLAAAVMLVIATVFKPRLTFIAAIITELLIITMVAFASTEKYTDSDFYVTLMLHAINMVDAIVALALYKKTGIKVFKWIFFGLIALAIMWVFPALIVSNQVAYLESHSYHDATIYNAFNLGSILCLLAGLLLHAFIPVQKKK